MKVSLFIALRYLFARKSHNVINVISAISAIGMAIGTAALILILSVFNGFSSLVDKTLSDLDSDALLVPLEGKFFEPDSTLLLALAGDPNVSSVIPVVQENVFVSYDGRQSIALARGVGEGYEAVSRLGSHIVEGELNLRFGELKQCCLGTTLAYELGAHPHFSDRLEIYYPDRFKPVSMSNPASSLNRAEAFPSGVVALNNESDRTLLLLPLELMQDLCSCGNAVTGLEIRLRNDSPRRIRALAEKLGPEFRLLDRRAQHPQTYKMMEYEKLAVYLILLFVVVIIAFNIFGSLSMLVIEKKDDIATLRAIGASDSLVNRIFILEGWLVSLLGMCCGLILGTGLALLQKYAGIVKMPGNFLVDSYPVILEPGDIAATAAGVALIGFLVALTAPGPGRVRGE